jgi:hypothetical protein
LTEDGEVQIEVPRDRAGAFEGQSIGKGQRCFDASTKKSSVFNGPRHDGAGDPEPLWHRSFAGPARSRTRFWTKSGIGLRWRRAIELAKAMGQLAIQFADLQPP